MRLRNVDAAPWRCMVQPMDNYEGCWRRHRRLRWIPLIVLLTFPAYWGAVKLISGPKPSLWLMVPFAGALLATSYIFAHGFRCPRCHKPFFHTAWFRNDFARRCVHCGLPKYASSDPDA